MKPLNTIYVVGGGSAGAMTACTIKKFYPDKDVRILQGRNIPVIGVGESTLATINGWLNIMDIKDHEWMKECDASYKLSIRFQDFNYIGELNDWYFKKYLYPNTPNSDYANCIFPVMSLVNQNKITDQNIFPDWKFKSHSAYHFDAIKFGNWLKTKN